MILDVTIGNSLVIYPCSNPFLSSSEGAEIERVWEMSRYMSSKHTWLYFMFLKVKRLCEVVKLLEDISTAMNVFYYFLILYLFSIAYHFFWCNWECKPVFLVLLFQKKEADAFCFGCFVKMQCVCFWKMQKTPFYHLSY